MTRDELTGRFIEQTRWLIDQNEKEFTQKKKGSLASVMLGNNLSPHFTPCKETSVAYTLGDILKDAICKGKNKVHTAHYEALTDLYHKAFGCA